MTTRYVMYIVHSSGVGLCLNTMHSLGVGERCGNDQCMTALYVIDTVQSTGVGQVWRQVHSPPRYVHQEAANTFVKRGDKFTIRHVPDVTIQPTARDAVC